MVIGNSVSHGNLKFVCEKSNHFGVWTFCFNGASSFPADWTFYSKPGGKRKKKKKEYVVSSETVSDFQEKFQAGC